LGKPDNFFSVFVLFYSFYHSFIFIVFFLILGTAFCSLLTPKDKPLYKNQDAPIDARVEDLLSQMTIDEKIKQIDVYFFFTN
jgi:hypothetical protein